MVKINLNNMQYRYDVYHMINLFYGLDDILFVDDEYDYKIEINDVKLVLRNNKDEVIEYIFDTTFTIKEEVKKAIFKYFENLTHKELPWGTLIGIRPSKIAVSMIEKGKSDSEIIDYFKATYLTKADKTKLCMQVAKSEKKFINRDIRYVSVYVGMPFCPTTCLYCSFASNPISRCKNIIRPYLDALKLEIMNISRYIKEKELNIETVYFGGGTPTSVDDKDFKEIMGVISENFVVNKGVKEFTVECGRPDSITYDKLLTMKEYGVDRISINPQTMNNETLKLIGRNHSAEDVIEKYNMARELGFDNINMDIIVGLPGENLNHIENTYNEILKLKPDSLTVHGLSVKRASKLRENIMNNIKYEVPEQDQLNKMYEKTSHLAKEMGMAPYYMYRQRNMVGNMDNVGYCLKDKECIYNIEMIEDKQMIIAIGADAVSKVVFNETGRIERFGNVKDVREYIKRIDEMIDKKIQLLNTAY